LYNTQLRKTVFNNILETKYEEIHMNLIYGRKVAILLLIL